MSQISPVPGTSDLADLARAVFSDGGALARVVDGYEPRDGQRGHPVEGPAGRVRLLGRQPVVRDARHW